MQKLSPYVSDRRRRRVRRRKYFLIGIGILAFYGIFFIAQWFVINSPIFRVASVKVVGTSAVASSDVIALAQAAADPAHHLFAGSLGFGNMLLWPDRIPASDTAMIPQLAGVAVSKDYFSHTVTLTVTERTPDGIWCFTASSSSTQCYWFDNAGTIFQRAVGTQGALVYVVDDSAQRPTGLNEKILPQEFLLNFLSVVNVLRQTNLAVKAIDITDLGLQQVDVVTANGPTIYFSLNFPSDEYVSVIQKLMLQPNFDRLQYIDCTTQNRVYYK